MSALSRGVRRGCQEAHELRSGAALSGVCDSVVKPWPGYVQRDYIRHVTLQEEKPLCSFHCSKIHIYAKDSYLGGIGQ